MHSLVSGTVRVADTDSDTDNGSDNESAVRMSELPISFSTSGSQCMAMITAIGLPGGGGSNKYLFGNFK